MFLTLQIFSTIQVHLQIYFYFYSTHLWTSSGKVALNISVWRFSFCGMPGKDTNFFISAPKPISSMRSASSSTKYFTLCKPICKYFSQRKTLFVHWQYALTKYLNWQNPPFTYLFQVNKKGLHLNHYLAFYSAQTHTPQCFRTSFSNVKTGLRDQQQFSPSILELYLEF